jgi:hypothetical protein
MMDATGELESIRQDVFDALRVWAGYPALVQVMSQFPHLKVYLAGGVVRNVILGQGTGPKDFDFFLGGEDVDQSVRSLGESGRLLSGPYGSPRWQPRPDVPYCDLIPITQFVPGLWPCEDIIDVLNQFDITGNAVAIDLRNGELFDPQNGCRDLRRRVLRAVRFDYPNGPIVPGHPLNRLVVLWFRLIHYAASLGLSIEPLTRKWLADRASYRTYHALFAATFFEPHTDALGLVPESPNG